jgi:hypothetical protein
LRHPRFAGSNVVRVRQSGDKKECPSKRAVTSSSIVGDLRRLAHVVPLASSLAPRLHAFVA